MIMYDTNQQIGDLAPIVSTESTSIYGRTMYRCTCGRRVGPDREKVISCVCMRPTIIKHKNGGTVNPLPIRVTMESPDSSACTTSNLNPQ